jgi:hypothetical protein
MGKLRKQHRGTVEVGRTYQSRVALSVIQHAALVYVAR